MENRTAAVDTAENVVRFVRPSTPHSATTALDLVYQAADVFSDMQDQARKTEARAHAMYKTAIERLKLAERQVEAAELARRDIITEADCKLQEAARALKLAELRIATAEEQAAASEQRAQVAEARTNELKDTLALVEDAIRRRFLHTDPEIMERLHVA